jgi:allantoinase
LRTRNFEGYAGAPPELDWGGGKRIAIAIVLNYEEGAEYSVLDGDGRSEASLTDAGQSAVPIGIRDLAAESMFEFGGRVGVWRLLRLFEDYSVSATVSAAALALERSPQLVEYLRRSVHAVQGHGYRWINQFGMDDAEERRQITSAIESFEQMLGRKPQGWMCRYGPSSNTQNLLLEHDNFLYHSDSYADELPYWQFDGSRPILVIPHTFANNDNKFAKGWFAGPKDYFEWHRAALDTMRREPVGAKLLTVSLHCRLSGQAARAEGVRRFLDHAAGYDDVAFLTRDRVYQVWSRHFPAYSSRAS